MDRKLYGATNFMLSLALTLFLLFAFSSGAQALMLKLSLSDLTEGADAIVLGTVVSTESYWNDDQTNIFTEVVFSVDENIKGSFDDDLLTVIVPGGTVGDISQWVSDTPQFEKNKKSALFLEEIIDFDKTKKGFITSSSSTVFTTYGQFQGKLKVKHGKVDGIPLKVFREQVHQMIQGGDSLNSNMQLDCSEVSVIQSGFTYTGKRWFGSSPLVEYKVNATAAQRTAVQNAANTWSNAGANFNFNYGGTHSRTGTELQNGINEILWHDLGASPMLAYATIWFYNTGQIFEADMVFNTYYNWSTFTLTPHGQIDVETVALHEFGHWLHLCHSDVYEAVMYESYKGTQRTLHSDDSAGIKHIYGSKGHIPVTSVNLNKTSLTLTQGETETLVATVSPEDATNKSVIWSSSDSSIASINSSGLVTAVVPGTAVITGMTVDGSKTATCTVTVTALNIPVSSVSLKKSSISLFTGETETLVAKVSPEDATNKSVIWSSSDSSIASVNSSGLVTAVVPGTAVITVMTADGSKSATCTVTVLSDLKVSRIAGSDRFTTAVKVSKEGWPQGSHSVLLARSDDYADALAGVPLAYRLNAPILLTHSGSLSVATGEEIRRLGAERVIILGGDAAISPGVAEELENMDLIVERIDGDNRYATAAKIAERLKEEGSQFNTAFIAVGTNFADALAASSYAAVRGQPILLTPQNQLSSVTEKTLQQLGIINTIVCGGEGAISKEAFAALQNKNYHPIRIFGNDRYETAKALSDQFLPSGTKNICLATGLNFPDAIAGGVLAAKRDSGVLLVRGNQSIPNPIVQEFLINRGINSVTLFGGPGAISKEMESWF